MCVRVRVSACTGRRGGHHAVALAWSTGPSLELIEASSESVQNGYIWSLRELQEGSVLSRQ